MNVFLEIRNKWPSTTKVYSEEIWKEIRPERITGTLDWYK
jgi:hypothetical protein